jgi:hypothetical protein
MILKYGGNKDGRHWKYLFGPGRFQDSVSAAMNFRVTQNEENFLTETVLVPMKDSFLVGLDS